MWGLLNLEKYPKFTTLDSTNTLPFFINRLIHEPKHYGKIKK